MTERELPWRLDLYERADGTKPVEEFVRALQRSRPAEHRKVLSKFKLFEVHGLQAAMDIKLVAPLRGYSGIYEVRIKGTGFRFYSFTWRDKAGARRCLLAASAEEKSGKEADDKIIQAAAAAREDWYRRFGNGGE